MALRSGSSPVCAELTVIAALSAAITVRAARHDTNGLPDQLKEPEDSRLLIVLRRRYFRLLCGHGGSARDRELSMPHATTNSTNCVRQGLKKVSSRCHAMGLGREGFVHPRHHIDGQAQPNLYA